MNKIQSVIVTEIDALLGAQGKTRQVILSGTTVLLTGLIAKFGLSRFATADEILSLSTAISGFVCATALHFCDSHFGNANIQTSTPTVQNPPEAPKT